ncbi:tRNA uridine-5-carboxymethylaminomethyl(34) synthesis GTPase MnmE [bacterium]|nr:tRNA uridine-5-carboxymethylaminomethyl(34) synthesis GTPase MnmE [bacterium]
MLDDQHTIVALATPEGRGGLAVVRLSGPDALPIARRVVGGGALDDPVESHRARLATVAWPRDERGPGGDHPGGGLDQVLLLPMIAPSSYTGEDTVEFSCHGGVMPSRLVVAALIAAGARPATAGEFTRRAFLNGRLGLADAEGVADLIAAEHAPGARAALNQLRGGLARRLASVEAPLRELLAQLEGAIEFGEEAGTVPDRRAVAATVDEALAAIDGLLDLVPAGRLLRDGVQVVLVGEPNAGKSSLFNALLGEDRVIVDATPGTTRDAVAEAADWEGLRVVLHDTAGLRTGGDRLEVKGMARTRDEAARADIVLALRPADATGPPPAVAAPAGAAVIEVVTKGDLVDAAARPAGTRGEDAPLTTSAVTGTGLAELRERVVTHARATGLEAASEAGIMLNQRHQGRLLAARDGLRAIREAGAVGDEVVASLLTAVLRDLDSISGRVFTERLLDDVFGRFCVGK